MNRVMEKSKDGWTSNVTRKTNILGGIILMAKLSIMSVSGNSLENVR